MKTVQFFLLIKPPTITHQEKKVRIAKGGKPILYEPRELAAVRQKFMELLADHAPEEPMTGPIRLITKWCYPKGKHKDGEYRTTKPDTDNLQKLLKDCMTACGFWRDDCLVASEIVEKFWADNAGIFIGIEVLK